MKIYKTMLCQGLIIRKNYRSQVRWYGHIVKMSEDSIAKIVIEAKSIGERRKSRLRVNLVGKNSELEGNLS